MNEDIVKIGRLYQSGEQEIDKAEEAKGYAVIFGVGIGAGVFILALIFIGRFLIGG